MAASIVVDIKAKISGYEQEIERIKSLLKNIKVDSSVGKELTKDLKAVEQEVNNLAKHITQKFSSESQISGFTDKLNQLDEKFIHIGESMSNVKAENLDFSKVDEQFVHLIEEIDTIKASLNEKIETGFSSAVSESENLNKAFKRLKLDITGLSSTEVGEALASNLETVQQSISDSTNRIKELKGEIKSLETARDNLSNKPILQMPNATQASKDILGDKKDLGITGQVNQNFLKEFTDKINSTLESAKPEIQKKKDEINKILESIGQVSSFEEMKTKLEELKKELTGTGTWTSLGLDSNKLGQTAKNLFSEVIDPQQVEDGLKQVKEKLQAYSLSDEEINKIIPNVKENLLSGNFEKAKETIRKNLEEIKTLTEKEINEITEKINNLNTERADLMKQRRSDKYTQGLLTKAQDEYGDIIKQLQDENKQLNERVKALEDQLKTGRENTLNNIKSGGRNTQLKASEGLRENIENAQTYQTELQRVQEKEKLIGKIEGVVQRWFSIYAAVRMVGQAVRSVISTVQELDKTITQIAIVTNMTQDQLWGQMQSYTDMARQYATSISGVYEVSQLYYQQGLQTADVMALTEETLKMARISGLDYATATDYMTNAVRSFKMEMTDAQTVVDVYSEIAASSATSTTELATAMSKTASSAQAVGASFENTTAMMAVMIEATRESAENIGSAMKSIISRYGEMTKDPSKLTDSEGEAMSLNKVDKALQTVGISIHDAQGQFREFDDVITELAGKWDTIDTNTQRYIATIMAGNRQQSRFLALVSNGERLAELSEKAANSQDAATLQVLKTMDSIEAKTQQLQTSLQSLYTSTGIQNFFKGLLDYGNNIVKTFTQMQTIFGAPIPAIIKIGTTFASLANVVTTVFGIIKAKTQAQIAGLTGLEKTAVAERITIAQEEANEKILIAEEEEMAMAALYQREKVDYATFEREKTRISREEAQARKNLAKAESTGFSKKSAATALGLNIAGVALSAIAGGISDKTKNGRIAKGITGIGSSIASMSGMGLMMSGGNPIGAGVGAALGAVMGLFENINFLVKNTEEEAKRLRDEAEEARNTYLQNKSEYTDLQEQIEKLKELEKARNDSKEANEAYLEASNTLVNSYPELISYITQEGNAIVDLSRTYDILADARLKAQQAAIDSAKASAKEAETNARNAENNRGKERQLAINDFLDQEVIEGSNKETRWKSATNREYLSSMALDPTNRDLLSLAAFDFRDKAEATEGEISDQYDLLATVYNTITTKNADIAEEFLNNNKEALQNIRSENKDDELIQAYFSLLDELTGDLLKIDADVKGKNAIADAANRAALQQLNYWQGQGKLEDKETKNSAKFLKEFDGVSEVIDNYVFNQFKTFKDNFTGILGENDTYLSKFEESKEYQDAYETIYNQLKDFYNSLKTEAQKQNFNDLLASRGQYSPDQFREILTTRYANIGSDLFDSLMSYYDDLFDFSDFITEIGTRQVDNKTTLSFGDKLSELNDLSSTELQSLLAVYDNISEQIKNNLISPDIGQEILNSYSDIWAATNDLDPRLREIAQSILTTFDDFSLTGIDELYSKLEAAGIDPAVLAKVDALRNVVPINLNTEIQSLIDKITGGLEDFEKALSSSSKGMDFKSAAEIAAKAGKSVQEAFDLRDGKLFIKNVEDIQKAYLGDNSEVIGKIKAATKEAQEKYTQRIGKQITFTKGNEQETLSWAALNGGKEGGMSIEDFTDFASKHAQGFASKGFSADELINYYTEYYNSAEASSQGFLQWVSEQLGTQMEDATKQLNAYVASLTANAALQAGDYQTFVNTVLADVEGEESLQAEREAAIELFKKGDLEALYERFPAFAQAISEAYSGISKGIYNKILSDTSVDKYVNATDINRSFLDKLASEGIAEKISDTVYKLADITEIEIDKYFSIINNDSNLSDTEKAQARAEATKALYEQSKDKLISDVIKDVESVEASVAEMFRQTYGEDAFNNVFESLGDGTYKVDLAALKDAINIDELNEQTQRAIVESVQSTADNAIKQLSTATSLISKGTTSPKEMQEFVTKFNEVTGESARIQDIFSYDQDLNGFILANEALNNFVIKQRETLQELGLQQTEIQAYLQENIVDPIAATIDFDAILSSARGSEASIKAHKDFAKAIDNYNTALLAMANEGEEVITLNAQALMDAISMGGSAAVQAAQTIASLQGKTLTAQQVEELYRREVSELVDAIDTVIAKPGEIVDATTASIIGLDNVEALGTTGQYVVQSAANLYEAYTKLLRSLEATGEATLADLNKVAALALENRDGEQAAIDALGDAAGMTFTRFGEILADAGIQLTETMIDDLETSGIIDLMGGNKMRIADFSRFADLMGWDANSEEYVSAFKTYNDSLIEMNRKAENNILEEVNALGDAKGGDWLNLTQLSERLETALEGKIVNKGAYDVPAFDNFIDILNSMGGHLQDGILKLDSDANIPGILATIASYAQQYGGLLQSDMVQLADTLDSVLQSYVDAISKGISGKLSNSDAFSLQQMVDSLDMNVNLEFTKTAEGMKLTKQSAIELYQELQRIDNLKAQLVFDDLYDSLTGDLGSGFNNMADTMATVTELQSKITKNQEKMAEISDQMQHGDASEKDIARLGILERQTAELEKQLDLAQEIATKQAGDPDSYNFMNGKLPDYLQGPANYWDSVGKAYKTMNEAASAGTIDLTDYYNIVNEMSNLAAMSGQLEVDGQEFASSAEMASYLIEQGANALTNVDGEGVKVDLSRLGVNFVTGANNMQDNFQDGIKAMADSQIAMLDAAIQLMETVVAMEKLGDIDVDNNGIFSIGDIFKDSGIKDNGDFTEDYEKWADNILKLADDGKHEDLQNALNNITVNGHTMRELIEAAKEAYEGDTTAWKELNISEKDYFAVMEAFVKAAENGDYDLDNILSSVQEILSNTLIDGTNIDTGVKNINFSGSSSFTIDWESDEGEKAIEQAKKDYPELAGDEEALRQKLQEAFTAYQKGEATSVQVVETLVAKGLIKLNVEEGTIELPDGRTVAADSATGQAAIAEAVSEDAGIENGQAIYDEHDNFVTYEGEITVGNAKIKTKTDSNNNVQYISEKTGQAYNSEEDLLQAEYSQFKDSSAFGASSNYSYEDWLYWQYHINIKTSSNITDEKGNPINANSSEIREELQQKITEGIQGEGQDIFEVEGLEGHYIVKMPSGNQIEFVQQEGESLQDAANRAMTEALGIDQTLIDNIVTAIKTAFSGDAAAQIGGAIADGLKSSLSGTQSDTQEIDISNITLKAQSITIDTSEVIEPTLDKTNFTVQGVNANGEAGTLTITVNDSTTPILAEGSTPPNLTSVNATADTAQVEAQSYTVTFTSASGETETVTVEGQANLEAVLSSYGVGFSNGTSDITGKLLATVETEQDNIELNTTANMTGAETAVNTWAANKVVQIQVKTASIDGATTEIEADPILTTELKNVTDLDSLTLQIQVSGAENGISNLEQYKAKIQEVLDAGQQLNSIDLSNIQSLSAAGLIDINLPTATSTIDNLEITSADNATYDGTLTLTEDISEGQGNISNLTVGATNLTANSSLAALQGMNFSTTSSSLLGVQNGVKKISDASFSNFSDLSGLLETIKSQVDGIWDTVKQFANQTFTVNLNQNSTTTSTVKDVVVSGGNKNSNVGLDTSKAQGSADKLSGAAGSMGGSLSDAANKAKTLAGAADKIPDKGKVVSGLASAIKDIPNKGGLVSNLAGAMKNIPDVASRVHNVARELSNIPTSKNINITATVKVNAVGGTVVDSSPGGVINLNGGGGGNGDGSDAKGNVALSKGTGPALAGGRRTLVGELGPELVVSGGKYYVVGQHGAEFVDLAPDAIVFNHLQTRELLKHGSSSRGDAVTSEKNAVALASGTSGPAMASASAALAALKQLRAMWQSLKDASAKDLGALAGKGGKGGGGGGGCFVAGTPIATREGFKNIEDIEVGDIVLSYNEASGKNEYSEVLQTMIHDVEEDIYTLHIENEELVVTGIHRFLIGNEWIPASALATGNLVRFADGTLHAITEIDVEEMATRVYNFEVSNNHNYYVGSNSILAHNKGGGGGGGEDDKGDNKSVTAEIQRWYNLTRQIAKAEKDITYQQALRSKYQSDFVVNGDKIYATYQKELAILRKEVRNQKELVELQKSWYDAKRKELEASDYGKIFTYDENGLQQYVGSGAPGSGRGLDILENLSERDVTGKPINNAKSAKAQLKYLRSVGFNLTNLLYNDDGTKAAKSINQSTLAVKKNKSKDKQNDIYVKMMENFWNNIDGWRDELDNLYDSYNDTLTNIEENQTKQNEILQELRDNELDIEQELLKAIESRKQAAIDEKTDLKDALKEASDAYISGLSEALDKERKQYEQNQGKDELTKLQRQLAILQRSGGSASQIRSLQEQISGKQRDVYFDERQSQIDAIQEASDKEIEALEREIDIMTETLEYQKENGLLWKDVRAIMAKESAQSAWDKILAWDSEMKSKSALDIDKTATEFMDKFDTFAAKRDEDKAWKEDKTGIDTSQDESKYSKLASDSTALKAARDNAMSAAEGAYRTTLEEGGTREQAKAAAQKAYDDEMASQSERYNRTAGDRENQEKQQARKDLYSSPQGQAASNLFDKIVANSGIENTFANKEAFKTWQEDSKEKFVKSMLNKNAYDDKGNLAVDSATLQKYAEDSMKEAATSIQNENAFGDIDENGVRQKEGTYITPKLIYTYNAKGKKNGGKLEKGQKIILTGQSMEKGKKKKKKTYLQAIDAAGKKFYVLANDFADAKEDVQNANTSAAMSEMVDKAVEKGDVKTGDLPPVTITLTKKKGGLKAKHSFTGTQRESIDLTAGKSITISGAKVSAWKKTKKGKVPKTVKEVKLSAIDGTQLSDDNKPLSLSELKNANDKKKIIKALKIHKYTKGSTFFYKQGGLADYTGPAWVDGTPKKPEAFLNAAQTQFVRNDLLGNSKTSLVSIVSALQDAISNTATSPITNNSNALSIGNINLTIESGVIANDYDARRAGSNITDEILKIAKKSGNLGISRR